MWKALLTPIVFLLCALTAPAGAQGMLPYGECAVVAASRKSLSEAAVFIQSNELQSVARVYESENGWLAITVGRISIEGSKATIARLKTEGRVPGDAYCSTGNQYVREVDWRPSIQGPPGAPSDELWADFDARQLSASEKRFLQAALAHNGYYSGLLDGRWGRGSQKALEAFTAAEFDGQEPLNAHAAFLTSTTIESWIEEGWEYHYISYLDLSVMLPMNDMFLSENNNRYQLWQNRTEDLQIHFNDLSANHVRDLHNGIETATDLAGAPYKLRDPKTWVTATRTRTGSIYLRSELIAGSWSTIAVNAGSAVQTEAALISSSIKRGSPVSVLPERNGTLAFYADKIATAIRGSDVSPSPADRPDNTPPTLPATKDGPVVSGSTGTGFYVTDRGVALTNAHVVEGCSSLMLDGKPADVVAISSAFDLAAIRLSIPEKTPHLTFAGVEVKLNSDITVAGYPLHGILGGLNIGRGSISSMKGLRGDETKIQISAPVQPGNSGGPAVDRSGDVVGVVVSKLDTVALADATGDIAQNVNFAIRGSLAMAFLSSNGIRYEQASNNKILAPEEAADLLQSATRLVECQ